MSERERQIGVNEALFRAVNEEIERLNAQLHGPRHMQAVCECGDAHCVERLEIPLEEYERVRKDARRFIVAPGHEIPDVETVLERYDRYFIIEKVTPEPEWIAEETDPRA